MRKTHFIVNTSGVYRNPRIVVKSIEWKRLCVWLRWQFIAVLFGVGQQLKCKQNCMKYQKHSLPVYIFARGAHYTWVLTHTHTHPPRGPVRIFIFVSRSVCIQAETHTQTARQSQNEEREKSTKLKRKQKTSTSTLHFNAMRCSAS